MIRSPGLGLLGILVAILLSGCAAHVPNVALVVGLGDYQHTSALPNPPRDATAVGNRLGDLGWSVTTATNPSRSEFEQLVRQFSRDLEHAKQAVFFYAGHGMQVDGRNYIVPVGFEPNPEGLGQLISLDEVLGELDESSAQLVVMLDACRDNPLSGLLANQYAEANARGIAIVRYVDEVKANATRSITPQIGKGLAELNVSAGTLIAYATQPGNVALDGEGKHSPFTAALLNHMSTLGQDVSWVLRQTRGDVIELTSGRQVPWDHSSLLEPFLFNPRRSAPPPP